MADKQIVLVVGSGGREHALAWKLSQSSIVDRIYVCPGNGGTASLPKTTNVNVSTANKFAALVSFAVEHEVRDRFDLTAFFPHDDAGNACHPWP